MRTKLSKKEKAQDRQMPEMRYVVSSNIEAIGYDEGKQELHVQFLASGGLHVYVNVPCEVFDALMSAPSKGSFLNREVRGVYDSKNKGMTEETRADLIKRLRGLRETVNEVLQSDSRCDVRDLQCSRAYQQTNDNGSTSLTVVVKEIRETQTRLADYVRSLLRERGLSHVKVLPLW